MPNRNYDFLVVGSGAAGSTAAVTLAEAGYRVAVLEEGNSYSKAQFKPDMYSSIRSWFRDFGMQMAHGKSVIPVLQGSCVGGTTVMNGAISHRLPKDVYAEWAMDKGIAKASPLYDLETHAEIIENDLGIGANWNYEDFPVSNTLNDLGWHYEAMSRNAPGCQATGRCLQGCPSGGKLSMENSYIPRAQKAGANILSSCRVKKLLWDRGKVVGVKAQYQGENTRFFAEKGVLLAAGVMHTPQILWNSGLFHPHLGKHFQCHLSLATAAYFDKNVAEIEGPPQGIEITEFAEDGIKLATQLLPDELLLARSPVVGQDLVNKLARGSQLSSWTGSIFSKTEGELFRTLTGKAKLFFNPNQEDLKAAKKAIVKLSELLFKLGAKEVYPGVQGPEVPLKLTSVSQVEELEKLSLQPNRFILSAGHLFGTCRMGSDETSSVVNPDFRVHGVSGLYVIDASIFPTNTGVNPQHSIMTLARHAATKLVNAVA